MSATTATRPANGAATTTKTRNRRAKMDVSVADKTVTFTVFNPDGTLSAQKFVAKYDPLPAEMKLMLGLDRLRNKLMDSYSDPESDIIAACQETYDGLMAGHWALRGESAERTSLFAECYAAHHKIAVDVARAKINEVEAGDNADKKAVLAQWRKHPAIVKAMAELSAKRAAERAAAAGEAAKGAVAPKLAAL